jgi:hypothetical protein
MRFRVKVVVILKRCDTVLCIKMLYCFSWKGKSLFKLKHYRPDAVFTLQGSKYTKICGFSHHPYPHQSPVSSQRRLPFNPRLFTVRFVLDPVAFGQSLFRVLRFFQSLSFYHYSILSSIFAFLLLEGQTSEVWDQKVMIFKKSEALDKGVLLVFHF